MMERGFVGLLTFVLAACSGDGMLGRGAQVLENNGGGGGASAETQEAGGDSTSEGAEGTGSAKEDMEARLIEEEYALGGPWENPGVAQDCTRPNTFADATVVGGEIDFDPIETWSGYFGAEGFPPESGGFTVYVKSRSEASVQAAIVFDPPPELQYSPTEGVDEAPAGYAFSVFDSVVSGSRWDFKVRKAEWLREWCESRASFAQPQGVAPEFACTLSTSKTCTWSSAEEFRPNNGPDLCWMLDDDERVAYEVSPEEMMRCTYVCDCNACGCTTDSTDQVMEFYMLRSGDEMHGLEDLTADTPTIHMTLVK